MNVVLWILQILLGLLFLFAGGSKLVMPIELMTQTPNGLSFPGWFIRFIGVCEFLGGLGLIMPGLFKKKQFLTPLAALGLAVIMIGAIYVSIVGFGIANGIGPIVILLLLLWIAYARWRVRPHV